MYKIYEKYRFTGEILFSLFVFHYLIQKGEMLKTIHFDDIVYAILSYVVILELIKMLGLYVFDRRFNMVMVLDTFFVFVLRETILVYSKKHGDTVISVLEFNGNIVSINEKVFYIFIGVGMMIVLLYFRNNRKLIKRTIKNKREKYETFFKLVW